MATYKVPQDVEAEDKLIAFLSMKQFIFVIIMIASLWMCWVLAQVNILLGLLPLPIAIVTGVLGLYQRKDQPVEVFLASWLRFRFKPRTRKWDQEGLEERVIITAPKVLEHQYTKGYSQEQVSSHLSQLSSMLDSRGWASKHSVDLNQSQRLFSMQELQQYKKPATPIEAEEDAVADQFDESDPRNRTVQEVSREFKGTAKKQREHTLEVIEKARSESNRPSAPTPHRIAPSHKSEIPRTQVTANSQQIEPIKPAPQQPRKTTPLPKQATDNEVVIDLHNQHKA